MPGGPALPHILFLFSFAADAVNLAAAAAAAVPQRCPMATPFLIKWSTRGTNKLKRYYMHTSSAAVLLFLIKNSTNWLHLNDTSTADDRDASEFYLNFGFRLRARQYGNYVFCLKFGAIGIALLFSCSMRSMARALLRAFDAKSAFVVNAKRFRHCRNRYPNDTAVMLPNRISIVQCVNKNGPNGDNHHHRRRHWHIN